MWYGFYGKVGFGVAWCDSVVLGMGGQDTDFRVWRFCVARCGRLGSDLAMSGTVWQGV